MILDAAIIDAFDRYYLTTVDGWPSAPRHPGAVRSFVFSGQQSDLVLGTIPTIRQCQNVLRQTSGRLSPIPFHWPLGINVGALASSLDVACKFLR